MLYALNYYNGVYIKRYALHCYNGVYNCRLYALNGYQIGDVSELENAGHYVAVGSEFGGFKRVDYGTASRPAFYVYIKQYPRLVISTSAILTLVCLLKPVN